MLGILAKAKRIDTSEWVEGYYVFQHGAHQIYILDEQSREHDFDYYHIDVDTLCLWTGRYDINNRKIWTNDIVRANGFTKTGVVMYSNVDCAFYIEASDGVNYWLLYFDAYEVLSNRFDDDVMGGISNEHKHDSTN